MDTSIIRVDSTSQASNPDGFSWPCAYPSLDEALDNIDDETQQIWVAQGVYKPTLLQVDIDNSGGDQDRQYTFLINEPIIIRGGFLGLAHPSGGETSETEADPEANGTVLSGDIGAVNDDSDNAYHVLVIRTVSKEDLEAILIDGFTITAGRADSLSAGTNGPHHSVAGAAYIRKEDGGTSFGPQFTRCKFIDNQSVSAGGAVLGYKSGARFRDCEFRNNTTVGSGFEEEEVRPGVFEFVYLGGGAICNDAGKGVLTLVKCTFSENHSEEESGGAVSDNSSFSLITNCAFYANTAPKGGGLTTEGTVVNCLFAGNRATETVGGGLEGVAKVHGCTFADN